MNGKSHQKNLSGAFQINQTMVVELLIPIILGILAIVAHARYRSGIKLPGHHGLEFMALLVIAHSSGKTKWSVYLFSLGVAAFAFVPFLGFKNPMVALIYAVPGIVFSLLASISLVKKYKFITFAIIGGFAYGSIPLIRFLLGFIFGTMHNSVIAGPLYPFIFFFLFGLAGSLIGLGGYILGKKIFK